MCRDYKKKKTNVNIKFVTQIYFFRTNPAYNQDTSFPVPLTDIQA